MNKKYIKKLNYNQNFDLLKNFIFNLDYYFFNNYYIII